VNCGEFSLLFDTGSSGRFINNAVALGIDIGSVELAVISHGHFDHAGGLRSLFSANPDVLVYMGRGADADLYARLFWFKRFVGLEKDVIPLYRDRIRFLDETTELRKGVFAVIPIKNLRPPPKGNRLLFRRQGAVLSPDDFSDELALAIESEGELVVFTGCSHHGVVNILAAVRVAYPNRRIKALFGGFHLVTLPLSFTLAESGDSIRALGHELLQCEVDKFYTAHCTGAKGYKLLKQVMGDSLEYFAAGSRVRL